MGLFNFLLGGKKKLKYTEELLRRNNRFSYVDSKSELARTPEFWILSISHSIRLYQAKGHSLAQCIYHTENAFPWVHKNEAHINTSKRFHDIVHSAANGSISDAVNAVYEYMIFRIQLEYPDAGITVEQIIDNTEFIESNIAFGDY